jgi:hypothetical protein
MEKVPAAAFFLLLGNLPHRCNLVIDEIVVGIDVIQLLVDSITVYVLAISFANRARNLCGSAAGGAADSSVTSAITAGLIISYVHITVNRFPVPVRVNFVGCMLVLLTGSLDLSVSVAYTALPGSASATGRAGNLSGSAASAAGLYVMRARHFVRFTLLFELICGEEIIVPHINVRSLEETPRIDAATLVRILSVADVTTVILCPKINGIDRAQLVLLKCYLVAVVGVRMTFSLR